MKPTESCSSAGACQQSLERALGAHPIAFEKRWMGGLGPDEIIAAVMCRSDNHVVRDERFERASKNRSRQMRAVAVERNDALPARRCEVCKHRGQACRKAFSLLRHDTHPIRAPAAPVPRHPKQGT